jgi:hypothetical protein
MSTTVIDLLDALRTHLGEFDVPPPWSVHLTTYSQGPKVSLQIARRDPPEIASALLAWAKTLTHVTAEIWRVPDGTSVHLSVTGRLSEGIQVQVYSSLPFTEHGIGATLTPGASTTVPWALLRDHTTPGEVTL